MPHQRARRVAASCRERKRGSPACCSERRTDGLPSSDGAGHSLDRASACQDGTGLRRCHLPPASAFRRNVANVCCPPSFFDLLGARLTVSFNATAGRSCQ